MSDKRVINIYDYVRFKKEGCYNQTCSNCPLSCVNNGTEYDCVEFIDEETDKANEIILKWCDEHPQKTRQSELLKLFPETKMDNGVVDLCPNSFKKGFANGKFCIITECDECRKKFWLEELE